MRGEYKSGISNHFQFLRITVVPFLAPFIVFEKRRHIHTKKERENQGSSKSGQAFANFPFFLVRVWRYFSPGDQNLPGVVLLPSLSAPLYYSSLSE